MERDELRVHAARIQYQLDSSRAMPICPESHVCFAVFRDNDNRLSHTNGSKRPKLSGPDTPFATANAFECDPKRVRVVGVSISGSLNPDAIKNHPLAAGRITVQCAGVVSLTTSTLDRDIDVGSYIRVDPESPIEESRGLPKGFGAFPIKRVEFMSNREHVIGRVCGIKLLSHGFYVLNVALALQPPAPRVMAPLSSLLTEESIFQTYMPPSLLHALWNGVTPSDVSSESNAQSRQMAEKLKEMRDSAIQSNQALANMIERAINEVEFTEVPDLSFPHFNEMSVMGLYAFLVGSKDMHGILWYAASLQDAKSIVSQILLLMPNDTSRADHIVSRVFKSDNEYSLFEKFDMWSKRHYQHSYEPLVSSLRSCLSEVQLS
jgi:hypothetical protein